MTRLLLVDANNIYYRAFHGLIHSRLHNEEGSDTFAVHGFISSLANVIKQYGPTHVLLAFDHGVSKHRLELYPEYKAARKNPGVDDDTPDPRVQLKECRELSFLLGFPIGRERDIEADDIIATCVKRFKDKVDHILIVSGDKDLFQLIDSNVHVLRPSLGSKKDEELWDAKRVQERYGVPPERLLEVWSLCGDANDGVPGVKGIGEITAVKLISKYGSLVDVAASDEKKVQGAIDDIMLTYQLIKLDGTIAKCSFSLEDLAWTPTVPGTKQANRLRERFKALRLQRLEAEWSSGLLWKERPKRRPKASSL